MSQPPGDSVALSHLQVKVGNEACPAHSSVLRTSSWSPTHCSAGFVHVTLRCFVGIFLVPTGQVSHCP